MLLRSEATDKLPPLPELRSPQGSLGWRSDPKRSLAPGGARGRQGCRRSQGRYAEGQEASAKERLAHSSHDWRIRPMNGA
jgi:hypothetical protein